MSADRRVVLLAFGTTGDVVPLVALSCGLRAAGVDSLVVTHARFAPLAKAHGLDCACIDDDPLPVLQHGPARPVVRSGNNALAHGWAMRTVLARAIEPALIGSLAAAAGANMIVASNVGMFLATSVGEKLAIPVVPALLHPIASTAHLPNPFVPWMRGGVLANRTSHNVFWHGSWLLFRPMINRARQRILGLAPLPPRPLFPGLHRPSVQLYGFSPAVVPKPGDWPSSAHVTGYWFLPASTENQIPPDLQAFVASGSPPICVGFGSMTDARSRELTRCIVEGVRRSGRRAVLLSGWARLGEYESGDGRLGDSIFVTPEAPHDWLFARATVLVHHGSAGTTAAALRAGKPSVTVPYFGDQFFWAGRLRELRAGTDPLPRRALHPERLARKITEALNSPDLKQGAEGIAQRLATEDGVADAVSVLGAHLAL